MTLDDFLLRVEGVRQRGGGRYAGLCPAHADKSPSLGISEGERGVLLKCWAGCGLAEICAALGIKQADLFFKSRIDPQSRHVIQQRRQRERREHDAMGKTIDACRQAEDYIGSRRGLDISQWRPQRLDEELTALAAAYSILESEGGA